MDKNELRERICRFAHLDDMLFRGNGKRIQKQLNGNGLIASSPYNHIVTKTKFAFTLAEVLITLGIIGIVAAMTMPMLLAKWNEAATVSKVKKFYSTMSNAMIRIVDENGTLDTWDYQNPSDTVNSTPNSQMMGDKFAPHLKVLKNCGLQSNCMLVVDYRHMNGVVWRTYSNYRDRFYYKLILNDGSHLIIKSQGKECKMNHGGYRNTCGYILYDVNGGKEPNMMGKDLFVFEILKNSIVPARYDNGTCSPVTTGDTGACYIMLHGNMNYLHE